MIINFVSVISLIHQSNEYSNKLEYNVFYNDAINEVF